MNIQVSEIAAFLGSVALIAKILDWYLTREEKKKLQHHILSLLKRDAVSGATLVKAPLSAISKLLDAALGGNSFSKKSFRRSSVLSIFILLSCLSIGGIISGTNFSISQSPWTSYNKILDDYEKVIEVSKENPENKSDDLNRIDEFISTARTPICKVSYLSFFILTTSVIGVLSTVFSLSFSRKVANELQKTESFILIAGSLLLGLTVSAIIANLCMIVLFTLSSSFVILSGGLGSLIFGHSKLLGAGIVTGYSLMAWLLSSVWAKAIAIGAIIPSLLLIIASAISGILFPFRSLIGGAIRSFLFRAVQSEKGVLIFFATGTSLLSAAIIMATNLVISGKS